METPLTTQQLPFSSLHLEILLFCQFSDVNAAVAVPIQLAAPTSILKRRLMTLCAVG
jgi:hypothetical protein